MTPGLPLRAARYGAYAAAAGAAWTLLEFALGFHGPRAEVGRWTGFVGLVFPVVAIVAALRAARRAGGGALSFGAGLAEAAGVSLVLAALGAAFFYAYHAWINPAFPVGGVPADPATQALAAGAGSLAVGLVVGLVAAAALRAPRPTR